MMRIMNARWNIIVVPVLRNYYDGGNDKRHHQLVHPVVSNNNQLKNGVNFYINPENDIMISIKYVMRSYVTHIGHVEGMHPRV
jgi:hypothetical protein